MSVQYEKCRNGHRRMRSNTLYSVNGHGNVTRRCATCKRERDRVRARRRWRERNRIPNGQLREAYLASGWSARGVARECGWTRHGADRTVPDSNRVRVLLGLKTNYTTKYGRRYVCTQKTIGVKDAEQIMRAIGADPFEVGL